ncbi:MAG: hypothetical protein GVY16_05410 [Planctomycetes bacterium]|nr:hypothetical protein [Phycisphaerae bacterium]NBB95160.1 hypothetical protein [Planctomycetota bacterium]
MKGLGILGKLWRILARFGLWWAGLFGLIGTGNCPCCGQPGCPGGVAGAGLFATLAAFFMTLFPWADKKSQAAKSAEAAEKEETKPS